MVVRPDFSSGFSAFSTFGLGEVEADGVQELEKSYGGSPDIVLLTYLGRDDGRMEGEDAVELGLISSPSSPGSKVTTEQNPSELKKRNLLSQKHKVSRNGDD